METTGGRLSVVHLPDQWYVACLSRELGGTPLARTVLGTPMALFRRADGRPVALVDRCPHRNVPLSLGRVREGVLECRYHGWRFDGEGRCRAVPGLDGDPDRPARRADVYPVVEQDGFVWVFPGAVGGEPATRPRRFPGVDQPGYVTVRRSLRVAATLHAALENTLDVPHTAFLHGGLFRGGRPPVALEVVVREGEDWVEAEYLGEPRPSGIAGRLLAPEGGVVTHVDRFLMPSIAQVEYRLGRHHLVVTSAFTPVSDFDTRLHAAVTFRLGVPAAVAQVVVTPIANRIFAQDAMILRRQAENIRRFGGEQFVSTDLDVLGTRIWRMLRRAERGETGAPDGAEHRVRMRV
ncbi:MAG TPA: aromatic ring-hydroxylating dioxygenase subunit alpha [Acidimicrobiales bacterium]|jgi:phenylpropionate dioxygenase-like ring-hydroxylating dioxygenase large terminal subunit|nr:aromatic ring-hydroxylating dioxygenase subunit alpha [Acidimicrobiales bacterium]